jgi:hypothetical protein
MGFFSGVTSAIGKVVSGATKAASTWGGKAVGIYTAAKTGNIASLIGQVGSSLMEKKAGGSGTWAPVDTSVASPSLGDWSMKTYKAGSAEAPDQRMKTVDADTLNQEWEYRLERGFRKVKSGSSLYR